MKTLIFEDPYITKRGVGAGKAHQFLLRYGTDNPGSIERITFRSVDLQDPEAGVVLEVLCSEAHASRVINKVNMIAYNARLFELHQELFTGLLERFSSPALTSRFLEAILHTSSGDTKTLPE